MVRKKKDSPKTSKTPVRNKRKADLIVSPVGDTEIVKGDGNDSDSSQTLVKEVIKANKKTKTMTSFEGHNNTGNANYPLEPVYSPGTVPTFTILGTNDVTYEASAQNTSLHCINTSPNSFPQTQHDLSTPCAVRQGNLNPNARSFDSSYVETSNPFEILASIDVPPPSPSATSIFTSEPAVVSTASLSNMSALQSYEGNRFIHNPFHPVYIGPPIAEVPSNIQMNLQTFVPEMPPNDNASTKDLTTPQLAHRTPSQLQREHTDQEEPPWVQGLLSKFFTRMDSIEDKLDKIINRVSRLESDVCAIPPLKEKVCELEKSVNFLSKSYDAVRGELKANYEELKRMEKESNSQVLNETHRRVSDLECRSMRDNLLFTGVPEQHRENAEETIKEIIETKMGIRQTIEFERVHRLGNHAPSGRPRALVAKFSRFKDREMIRTNAKNLKGTNIGIHEQFSKEINDKRKILYPKFKRARENNQFAKLILDYLIVDNQKFIVTAEGNIQRDLSYNKPPPTRVYRDNNSQPRFGRTSHGNPFTGHLTTHAPNHNGAFGGRSDTNSSAMTNQLHHQGQGPDRVWHRDQRYQFM